MKGLKTISMFGLAAALLMMVFSAPAMAWRGHGGGMGAANCVSQGINIMDGEAVSVNGTVSQIGYHQGMTVDTGEQSVTVYGIGPVWYWNSVGADRPVVGDQVGVEGRKVTFSDGTERIIAVNLTVGEESIALRDQDSGLPLWRTQGAGGYHGGGRRGGMAGGCPWGNLSPQQPAAQ